MLACLLVLSLFRWCLAAIMVRTHEWSFYGISRRHNLMTNLLLFWLWQSYCLLLQGSLSLRCRGCVINVSDGSGIHNSAFWQVVVFYNGLQTRWVNRDHGCRREGEQGRLESHGAGALTRGMGKERTSIREGGKEWFSREEKKITVRISEKLRGIILVSTQKCLHVSWCPNINI